MLQCFTELSNISNLSAIIEEPEAHLDPESQLNMVKMLSIFANKNNVKVNLFITTHSPYILTSFNLLMFANEVARENKELVEDYTGLTTEVFLDRNAVSAYKTKRDGKIEIAERSFDHFIRSESIDDASIEINRLDEVLFNIKNKAVV